MKYLLLLVLFFPLHVFAGGNLLLLQKINVYREHNGLNMVIDDPNVCALAEARLADIQVDFSHTKFFTRINEHWAGVYSENLARRFETSQETIDAWKQSPTHNQNLLGNFKRLCIRHENGYWVFIAWKPFNL